MLNKFKIPILIFLFGMIFTIIGSLFKIMHWPWASIFLIVGMSLEVVALILLIVILQKNSK